MSKANSEKLADRLNKADLKCLPYAKSPVPGAQFILNLNASNQLRVWSTDIPEVIIRTDKRKKQAVITAIEPKRTLHRSSSGYFNMPRRMDKSSHLSEIEIEELKVCLQKQDPFNLPGVNYKVTNRTISDESKKKVNEFLNRNLFDPKRDYAKNCGDYFNYEATAIVSKSVVNFLVGFDENSKFICALKKQPKSVVDAHEMLRPKDVPKGSIRQGEFFFVPATKKEVKKIVKSRVFESRPLELNSSHIASTTVMTGKNSHKVKYAIGVVNDERGAKRHKPLILSSWHRVVRNNEIRVSPLPSANTYWD